MVSRFVITPKRPAPAPTDPEAAEAPGSPTAATSSLPPGSPPGASGDSVIAAPAHPISRRAILLGLALIPPNVYWVGMIECVWHGLHFTCLSLAMNVVFFLLALMGGNALVARRWHARMFSQAELLTVFAMLAISSAICGHDKISILMGVIGHAARYA